MARTIRGSRFLHFTEEVQEVQTEGMAEGTNPLSFADGTGAVASHAEDPTLRKTLAQAICASAFVSVRQPKFRDAA